MTEIFVFSFLSSGIIGFLELLWYIKLRKQDITSQFVRFYFVYNFFNRENGLGDILEQFLHLLGRFEIILLIGKSIAKSSSMTYRSSLFLSILYTEQNIMSIGIFWTDIISVIGSYQFDSMFFSQLNQYGISAVLIFLTMPYNFYIKILLELFFPPQYSFFSLFFSLIKNFGRDFTI